MIINTFVEIFHRRWRGKIQQGQNLIIPQMNVCLLQREYARKQAYKFFMRLSSLTCMLLDWGMYVNAYV